MCCDLKKTLGVMLEQQNQIPQTKLVKVKRETKLGVHKQLIDTYILAKTDLYKLSSHKSFKTKNGELLAFHLLQQRLVSMNMQPSWKTVFMSRLYKVGSGRKVYIQKASSLY